MGQWDQIIEPGKQAERAIVVASESRRRRVPADRVNHVAPSRSKVSLVASSARAAFLFES
jgi:hypothetical protein